MKICRVSPHPLSRGGLQTHIRQLSQELFQKGVEQYFVCPQNEFVKENIDSFPVKIYESHCFSIANNTLLQVVPLCKLLYKVVTENDVDVIHAHHGFFYGLCGAVVSKLTRRPLVITLHGAGVLYVGWKKSVQPTVNRIFLHADNIVAVSKYTRNEVLQLNPNLSVQVIPGGVKPNSFVCNRKEIRKQYGFSSYEKIVIFVGRLEVRKGILDFLNAITFISGKRSIDPIKYVIVGDGNLRSQIEQHVQSEYLLNKVILIGWLKHSEVQKILVASDILVLPSWPRIRSSWIEGLPRTILEAQVIGLPIIATPVGGVTEAMRGYSDGILVNPCKPRDLADAIITLSRSKRLNDVHLQCSRTILKKYSWGKMADQYIKIYKNIRRIRNN